MAKITLAIGLALILLGVGFYFNAELENRSVTALIPTFFGLPVAILGAVGLGGSESTRKHTAHAAVMITLLGTLGGLGMGIPGAINKGMTASVTAQLIMGVLCIVHVALSVRSFISARKARENAA